MRLRQNDDVDVDVDGAILCVFMCVTVDKTLNLNVEAECVTEIKTSLQIFGHYQNLQLIYRSAAISPAVRIISLLYTCSAPAGNWFGVEV